VIAVPIAGNTNTPSDLMGRDVYIEYYTPKGFNYYKSQPVRSYQSTTEESDDASGSGESMEPQPPPSEESAGEGIF